MWLRRPGTGLLAPPPAGFCFTRLLCWPWAHGLRGHGLRVRAAQAAAGEVARACPDGVDVLINNAGALGSLDLASETCAPLPPALAACSAPGPNLAWYCSLNQCL